MPNYEIGLTQPRKILLLRINSRRILLVIKVPVTVLDS